MASNNAYGPQIVTDGLVLCLDANNAKSYPGAGRYWYDLSGDSRLRVDLFDSAARPTFTVDAGNGAKYFDFDGSDDFTQIAGGDVGALCSTAGSLSFWVKLADTDTYRGLYYIYDSAYQDYLIIRGGGSNTLNLVMEDGNSGIGPANPLFTLTNHVGKWCHLSVTQNDGNVNCYINGEKVYTDANDRWTDHLTSGATFRIGYSAWSLNYMNGALSILQVHNRGLSHAEVKQNYNTHRSRFGL
jgi:hypothetical protein